MNTDGMHSVRTPAHSAMNTGLAGFQAVYPRASHVARKPPDGKLDASGSDWISCSGVKDSIGESSLSSVRKASCFSAVSPVCGWNQCVKCVAPRLIAHSLMAFATAGATSVSSFLPWRTDATRRSWSAFVSLSRSWRIPKVLMPKYSEMRPGRSGASSVGRTGRSAISWVTLMRADNGDDMRSRPQQWLAIHEWSNVLRFVQKVQRIAHTLQKNDKKQPESLILDDK